MLMISCMEGLLREKLSDDTIENVTNENYDALVILSSVIKKEHRNMGYSVRALRDSLSLIEKDKGKLPIYMWFYTDASRNLAQRVIDHFKTQGTEFYYKTD